MQTLLSNQPADRLADISFNESLKNSSLIQGGSLWKKIFQIKNWDENTLWRLLPDLIKAKYRVVNLDPYEKKLCAIFLNLGHTMGHVGGHKVYLTVKPFYMGYDSHWIYRCTVKL